MSNVINKAALLEWMKMNFYRYEDQNVISGTFDIPTDKKRCHLCPDDAETCYCYDDKPSVEADVKEIEEALDEGRLTELTTEKLYQGVRQLLAKLAETQAEAEAKVNHFYAVNRGLFAERDALQAKLNQAVEALEYYARCRECGGKGYFEIPTGVEHSGIQEMRKEPCECHIAKAALQSIKGEDKNA